MQINNHRFKNTFIFLNILYLIKFFLCDIFIIKIFIYKNIFIYFINKNITILIFNYLKKYKNYKI